jgi:hypothetical protein
MLQTSERECVDARNDPRHNSMYSCGSPKDKRSHSPRPPQRVAIEPARIHQELADLQDLLRGSAERARPVFKKLNLQVRLFPVERAGERPYLRAVATCQLDALTSDVNLYPHPSGRRKGGPTDPGDGAAGPLPTVRRSGERAASETTRLLPTPLDGGSGAQ